MLSEKKMQFLRKMPCFLGIMVMTQFVSCEKEDATNEDFVFEQAQEEEADPLNYRALYSTHHTIGEEEAKALALDVSSMHDGDISVLKKGGMKTVSETRVLHARQSVLRSGSGEEIAIPDTLAYVFNFADNSGYAIICGDDRVNSPVLAYVEDGSLTDDSDNMGLTIALANMEDYVKSSILEFEMTKDSLRHVADSCLKIGNVALRSSVKNTINWDYTTTQKVEALIQTKWNQWPSPYNDYLPSCSSGGKAPAGCTIVATAQLMAYYEYPASVDGYTFHWSGMKSNPYGASVSNSTYRKDIGKLMYYVGKNVDAKYTCDGTSASCATAVSWLKKKYGYIAANYDYNWDITKAFLNADVPLLMQGYNKTNSEGHVWLIDGYRTTRIQHYIIIDYGDNVDMKLVSTEYKNNLLHINWGWGGNSDGWYASGVFKPSAQNYNFRYLQKVYVATKQNL